MVLFTVFLCLLQSHKLLGLCFLRHIQQKIVAAYLYPLHKEVRIMKWIQNSESHIWSTTEILCHSHKAAVWMQCVCTLVKTSQVRLNSQISVSEILGPGLRPRWRMLQVAGRWCGECSPHHLHVLILHIISRLSHYHNCWTWILLWRGRDSLCKSGYSFVCYRTCNWVAWCWLFCRPLAVFLLSS